MKKMLFYFIRWTAIGLVIIIVFAIIGYQLMQIKNLISHHIRLFEVLTVIVSALIIGVIVSQFYLYPIKLCARLILKLYSGFYEEFFKQGSKYFAAENKNKPFENIVQISFNEDISLMGFLTNITDDGNNIVFIPTSRRLTSGLNVIVSPNRVKQTKITSEQFLKFVVTSGAFPIEAIR